MGLAFHTTPVKYSEIEDVLLIIWIEGFNMLYV